MRITSKLREKRQGLHWFMFTSSIMVTLVTATRFDSAQPQPSITAKSLPESMLCRALRHLMSALFGPKLLMDHVAPVTKNEVAWIWQQGFASGFRAKNFKPPARSKRQMAEGGDTWAMMRPQVKRCFAVTRAKILTGRPEKDRNANPDCQAPRLCDGFQKKNSF